MRVLLAAVMLVQTAAPQPSSDPARVAEAFFDLLVKQDFAGAIAMSNANLVKMLPEDKLREMWMTLGAQAGPFMSRESGVAQPAGRGHAVTLPAAFARIKLDFVIGVVEGRVSGLNVRPARLPSAPPPYAKPDAISEREITVGSGDWALPGTLAMPAGEGPFPAVVLVHGSGPNDRDGGIGPNRPLRDIAHGLASRGIAVLRYDKRTRVHGARFAALPKPTVHEESIEDAALAVQLLATTPGIDARRIFVAGHSLGAMLVPRIAAAAPGARGFIVLAGPARPLEQAIVEQLEYLAMLDNTVTAEEQTRIDQAKKDLDAVRALKPDDAASNTRIAGVQASYWLDLAGYDPPVAAKAVSRPMLILQGERDYQVTMKEFARWQAALDGRPDVVFTSYPALNHLFMPGAGPGMPIEYTLPRHVDEQVIRDIADWIMKTGR